MVKSFFSIIIPVYNKEPHIRRSISSVLNQTYENFELIVVDDASTDGSLEKVKAFNDKRIKIYKRERPGPGGYAARNLGVTNSNGKWICFLDADDSWNENFLEMYYNAIQMYNDIKIFSSSWSIKNSDSIKPHKIYNKLKKETNHIITYWDYLKFAINKSTPINSNVAVVEKNTFLKSGMFPAGKCRQGGDVDTWLRLIYEEKKLLHINKLLATYHRDSVNMVTKKYQDLSIGCIVPTCEKLIKKTDSKREAHLLKKFSNKYLFLTIKKSIKKNNNYSNLLKAYYPEANPLNYLFLILSKIFFVNKLLRVYMIYKKNQ